MPGEPKFSSDDDPILERAIVRDDHATRWSEAELASEIGDAESAFQMAIGSLSDAEVILVAGGTIQASRCTKHLDELELISI